MTVKHVTHQERVTKTLLICGIIGPLLFTAVYMIEGAMRPGYDAWRQAISALSLSDQGWMQITNFVVSGLLICGFALGLRRTLREGRLAIWGTTLLACVGIGLIISGVFVTDPTLGYPPGTPNEPTVLTTFHGGVHFFIGAIAVFAMLPLACLLLAGSFASATPVRGGRIYSVITSVLMVAFFVAFVIAGKHNGPAGLYERLSIIAGMVWMTSLAIFLLLKARLWPAGR